MAIASHRSEHLVARVLSISCVALLLVSVGILVCSDSAGAASTTKEVWGYIDDNIGQPIEGSVVTVTMKWAGGGVRQTLTDTTDSTGKYSVTFSETDWDVGNRFDVVATYSGEQVSSTDNNANTQTSQQVDLTFPFAIPQLGDIIGILATAGVLGVMAITVVNRRR